MRMDGVVTWKIKPQPGSFSLRDTPLHRDIPTTPGKTRNGLRLCQGGSGGTSHRTKGEHPGISGAFPSNSLGCSRGCSFPLLPARTQREEQPRTVFHELMDVFLCNQQCPGFPESSHRDGRRGRCPTAR